MPKSRVVSVRTPISGAVHTTGTFALDIVPSLTLVVSKIKRGPFPGPRMSLFDNLGDSHILLDLASHKTKGVCTSSLHWVTDPYGTSLIPVPQWLWIQPGFCKRTKGWG
jgi:hypothetical protein